MKRIIIFLLLVGSSACRNQKESFITGNWIAADIGEYTNNTAYGVQLTIDSSYLVFKSIGKPEDTINIKIFSDSVQADTSIFTYQLSGDHLTNFYDSLNQVTYTKMIPDRSFDESHVLKTLQTGRWRFTINDIEHQITFLDSIGERSLIRSEYKDQINTCRLRIKYSSEEYRDLELTYYTVENYRGQTFLRIENVFDYQFTWLMMIQEITKQNVRAKLWQEGKHYKINLKRI